MNKKIFSIICSTTTLLFIAGCLSVTPVWSAPGDKKPSIQNSTDIGIKESSDLKDSGKRKKSVKKKVVKKAGTAAAVGAAGKKLSSGVKGNVIKDKE